MQAGEFIYERPSSGEVAYTFKHALTQVGADAGQFAFG